MRKRLIKAKYQLIISKCKSVGPKYCNSPKSFIECSNDNVYENTDEYNQNKKRKILILIDDMIADMLSNKRRIPVVTKSFIRGRKLNISLVFITQCYCAMPKDISLNSTHYFIMNILNKQEPQQIAFHHLSDIHFKVFISLYKEMYCKAIFFFKL